MVTYYAMCGKKHNHWLFFDNLAALTAGLGFDQCPAPFAGPSLQIAATTPDTPFLFQL